MHNSRSQRSEITVASQATTTMVSESWGKGKKPIDFMMQTHLQSPPASRVTLNEEALSTNQLPHGQN